MGQNLLTVCSTEIDTAIAGLSQAVAGPVFSTANHTSGVAGAGTYVRNVNNWLYGLGVDLTCVPVWQSQDNDARLSGTVVSDHFLLCVNHASLWVGTKVDVCDKNNVLHTLSVADVQRVGTTDINVVRVNESTKALGITPMAIAPADWYYRLLNWGVPHLPVVMIMGGGFQLTDGALYLHPVHVATVREITQTYMCTKPTDPQRAAFWWDDIENGDSCSRCCLLLGNKLALVFHVMFGGDGSTTGTSSIPNNIAGINTLMGTMLPGGGESLTIADMSGYDYVYDSYILVAPSGGGLCDFGVVANYQQYNSGMQNIGPMATTLPHAGDMVYSGPNYILAQGHLAASFTVQSNGAVDGTSGNPFPTVDGNLIVQSNGSAVGFTVGGVTTNSGTIYLCVCKDLISSGGNMEASTSFARLSFDGVTWSIPESTLPPQNKVLFPTAYGASTNPQKGTAVVKTKTLVWVE